MHFVKKSCENIMKAQQEEIKIKGKKESNIDGLLSIKTSLDETIKKRVGGLEKKMENILDTISKIEIKNRKSACEL